MSKVKNHWLECLLALVFLLAVTLYLRPYYGIRHDSILYLGQAYLNTSPDVFGQDLFFQYGSQASFTLFPAIAGALLSYFSAPPLFQALTLFGLFAFVLASAFFVRHFFSWERTWWSLLALLILPVTYGGFRVFSYSESFFTARSLAEPLLIAAMAFGVRRRYLLVVPFWGLAALLHPLQALAVLLIAWCWLLSFDKRWVLVLLPAILGTAALAALYPDSSILARYDAQWLEWIETPNKQVFLSLWDFSSWSALLVQLFLLILVSVNFSGTVRRVSLVLFAATLLGCGLSLVLVDGLKLVLPTGLQLWRVTWVSQWWVALLLPQLLLVFYRKSGRLSPDIALVIIAVILGFTQGVAPPYAVPALIPVYFALGYWGADLKPRSLRLVEMGLWLALLVIGLKYASFAWGVQDKAALSWGGVRLGYMLLAFPLFSGFLAVAAIVLWKRSGKIVHALYGIAGVLFLFFAMNSWDQRSEWTHYVESQDSLNPFGKELRAGVQVYWQDELLAPWLVLRRPSYFSGAQSAGLLFNRGTAEEFYRRSKVTQLLEMQTQVCDLMNGLNSSSACLIDVSALKDACTRGEGQLGYLVTSAKVEGYEGATWRLRRSGNADFVYYLYDCQGLVPGLASR